MRSQVLFNIYRGVDTFLWIIDIMLLAYCVLSWITRPTNGLYRFLARFLDPILTPFRRLARWLMDKGFTVDLTVLLAFAGIYLARNLLGRIFIMFIYG